MKTLLLSACLVLAGAVSGCATAWQKSVPAPRVPYVRPVVLPRGLQAIERVKVAEPRVIIDVLGEGEARPEEIRERAQKIEAAAVRALREQGYEVVSDGEDAVLQVEHRLYRNSPGRKAANAAFCLIASPLVILSQGLCVPPPPYWNIPPDEVEIFLVDAVTNSDAWREGMTTSGSLLSPAGATRELVRRMASRRSAVPRSDERQEGATADLPPIRTPGAVDRDGAVVDVPPVGARVIVERTDGRSYIGTVAASTDVLTIETMNGRRINIPRSELKRASRF